MCPAPHEDAAPGETELARRGHGAESRGQTDARLGPGGARGADLFAVSAEQGAQTSVYLASSVEVADTSGRYFVKSRPTQSSKLSYDVPSAQRLWTVSAQLCGLSEHAPPRPPERHRRRVERAARWAELTAELCEQEAPG